MKPTLPEHTCLTCNLTSGLKPPLNEAPVPIDEQEINEEMQGKGLSTDKAYIVAGRALRDLLRICQALRFVNLRHDDPDSIEDVIAWSRAQIGGLASNAAYHEVTP